MLCKLFKRRYFRTGGQEKKGRRTNDRYERMLSTKSAQRCGRQAVFGEGRRALISGLLAGMQELVLCWREV